MHLLRSLMHRVTQGKGAAECVGIIGGHSNVNDRQTKALTRLLKQRGAPYLSERSQTLGAQPA